AFSASKDADEARVPARLRQKEAWLFTDELLLPRMTLALLKKLQKGSFFARAFPRHLRLSLIGSPGQHHSISAGREDSHLCWEFFMRNLVRSFLGFHPDFKSFHEKCRARLRLEELEHRTLLSTAGFDAFRAAPNLLLTPAASN